ncbi:MAG: hypothetical protein LUD51_04985 [Clostridia bacterium]|nr:hypothetical protein [Clostridia bacterium]
MATSSIFDPIVINDPEGMKILAEKLKEFEEYEGFDSEKDAESPCSTKEELREFLTSCGVYKSED